ncbi:MAG TPA: o-succinylbenzoate synthase [Coleofasciculaceae cyanobacterium]|jgi:O-succinylbenzoate synthase
MLYQFAFRPYQRPFKRVLSTSHGNWDVRQGIILRLRDHTGRVGWGEIAPIPWFGSETLEQALDFCQQLPPEITAEAIFSIPVELPACQFGFESAWEWVSGEWGMGNGDKGEVSKNASLSPTSPLSPYSRAYCFLLPAGNAALESWQTAWDQGSRTFKWKIGVTSVEEEFKIFNQLIQSLPQSVQLRLDANGGLTGQEAKQWLRAADQAGIVEFLEQPLPPEQFDAMLEMSAEYSTPIALDESVATLDQLEACYQQGWRGIFVIKAAIAGSPKRLRQFCQNYDIDTVFSSVFESAIARQAALQLAAELSNPNRAIGFGVNHWFHEDDETWLVHLWKEH